MIKITFKAEAIHALCIFAVISIISCVLSAISRWPLLFAISIALYLFYIFQIVYFKGYIIEIGNHTIHTKDIFLIENTYQIDDTITFRCSEYNGYYYVEVKKGKKSIAGFNTDQFNNADKAIEFCKQQGWIKE